MREIVMTTSDHATPAPAPDLELEAARIWGALYQVFGSRRRHETVWEALANLSDDEKRAIDDDAEAIIARELAAVAPAPAPDGGEARSLKDILWSIHWHASHGTVNSGVFADLANEALAALASPSLPASIGTDTKISQAYQVIGHLLDRCSLFDSPEGQRALDYFCAGNEADENFLPWPREPLSSSERAEDWHHPVGLTMKNAPAGDTVAVKREWLEGLHRLCVMKEARLYAAEIISILDGRQP